MRHLLRPKRLPKYASAADRGSVVLITCRKCRKNRYASVRVQGKVEIAKCLFCGADDFREYDWTRFDLG
jgi:ribosomal protein L37E